MADPLKVTLSAQKALLASWTQEDNRAYRKPAFQPSAFRRLFIGFQPSAEKKPISMEKGAPSLGLRKITAYQSEHFLLEIFTSLFQK